MKNLKEHTPNPDAWERILQQGQFETQLANHLKNLPQFSPNEEAWQKITKEMDRKKTIPIWVKWGVAACILGFLLVAGISISRFDNDPETQLLSIQNTEISAENAVIDSISIEPSQPIEPGTNISEKKNLSKITKKQTVEIIEVPKINLPELKSNNLEHLSLSLPEPQIAEPIQPKTLHQVSISWRKIKPGLQVRTPFGHKGIDPKIKTQASSNSPSQITIEINN